MPVFPPELAATLATTFELGCSTLLILGLGTRLATLPLLGMIATIQLFVYPDAWPEHLVWGSILLFLLTRGPGVDLARSPVARRGSRPPLAPDPVARRPGGGASVGRPVSA